MRTLVKTYNGLVTGLAIVSGSLLVWLGVAVIFSVMQRNLGYQPTAWLFLSTEYGMFYLTLLGAPWLVRERGHVHIELLTAALSRSALNVFSRLVCLLCVIVCAVMAFKGAELVQMNLDRGDLDVRAYFYPTWLLNITFPVSFTLMAIEFMKFVVGREILHTGETGLKE
ncbi:TRAP transporter small permease [Orrella marina]|uniref:TRAP transporter small permease protein n=1 Tax=Orrella marina TaxID=2163011 RepID=A0A2R4XMP0_9BURK|nr:TRAP transporter small permease subunit [Orrella marina]AWB35031.1 C4-dicarboxylate ABC transporter permease [Orrella marina]